MNTSLLNIEIIKLQKDDLPLFKKLIKLFIEVFDSPEKGLPSEKHLSKLLTNPYFHVFVARIENHIIAGMTAYELIKYYSEKAELYIYDIAVKDKFQNKGIGKKLISHIKEYAGQKGMECVFVQTEAEDEQAIKFYESAIGKGMKTEHFTIEFAD